MNRHMKIIFTLSLLLNATLIGVIAGASYQRWNHMPPAYSRTQDSAFNDKMSQAMATARKGQEPLFKDMRAARQQMNDILAADQFDEAAYSAAADKLRTTQAAMFDARQKVTLDMARTMSAAERKELAARFKAMGARHGRKGEIFNKGDKL